VFVTMRYTNGHWLHLLFFIV